MGRVGWRSCFESGCSVSENCAIIHATEEGVDGSQSGATDDTIICSYSVPRRNLHCTSFAADDEACCRGDLLLSRCPAKDLQCLTLAVGNLSSGLEAHFERGIVTRLVEL